MLEQLGWKSTTHTKLIANVSIVIKTAEMGPRIVSLCGPTNAPSGTRGPDDLGLVGGAGSNKVDYTARALYYVWTKPA